MLKHLPQQLMLKSEKHFMKLVGHRGRHTKDIKVWWLRHSRTGETDCFPDWRAAFYTCYDLRSMFTGIIC